MQKTKQNKSENTREFYERLERCEPRRVRAEAAVCIQAGGQGRFYQSEAGRDLGVKEKMREKERPRSSGPHGRGQERHLGPSSTALRTLPWKGSGAGRSGYHSSAIVISPLAPAGPGAPLPGRQGGLTPVVPWPSRRSRAG